MILKPSNDKQERVSMMDAKGKIPYEMLLNKKGRARLPDKLMDHLNNEELSEVIWWLPDGQSFAMDAKTIQEKFLDIHFRGTKLTSFIRSLNRWGFRRVFFHAMPRNAICFQSPHFKKGSPKLLREMKLAAAGAASSSARATLSPERNQAAAVAAAASAAAASTSQVDALFGDDLAARLPSQHPPFVTSHMASLRQAPVSSLGGLENPGQRVAQANLQFQSRLNSLSLAEQAAAAGLGAPMGQAGLSATASHSLGGLSFPGLPLGMSGAQERARQQALLSMMQREELLQQLQRPPSPNSRTLNARTLDYIQGGLSSRSAAMLNATNSLLAGQQPLRQQIVQRDALTARLLYGNSLPLVSETKQDDTQPRSAREASVASAEAALAEHLAELARQRR